MSRVASGASTRVKSGLSSAIRYSKKIIMNAPYARQKESSPDMILISTATSDCSLPFTTTNMYEHTPSLHSAEHTLITARCIRTLYPYVKRVTTAYTLRSIRIKVTSRRVLSTRSAGSPPLPRYPFIFGGVSNGGWEKTKQINQKAYEGWFVQ